MKRIFVILSLLITVIAVACLLHNQADNKIQEQYLYYEQATCTVNGTMTVDFANETIRAINLIPRELLRGFFNDRWKFVICNTDKNYWGLTDTNSKLIFIYYKQYDDKHTVVDTVLHEIGHYYDYTNNFISESNEFTRVYDSRVYKDFKRNDNYCYTNKQELYATIFRDSILYRDSLDQQLINAIYP